MRLLRAWGLRIIGLVTGRRRARHFETELASHLEMHVDENIARGMTPEEARRQAVIALGGIQATREAYRERFDLGVLFVAADNPRSLHTTTTKLEAEPLAIFEVHARQYHFLAFRF